MVKKKMNWSQVRHRTDSGETQDKVDHPDPAAAPLGTDEEAGGARTSPEDIAKSEHARTTGSGDKERGDSGKRPNAP